MLGSNVTERLGSTAVDHYSRHVCSQTEQLLGKRTASGRGGPFDGSWHATDVGHAAGMLPATDALLACSRSCAIGMLDPSPAPFGVRVRDSTDATRRRAQHVNREVAS